MYTQLLIKNCHKTHPNFSKIRSKVCFLSREYKLSVVLCDILTENTPVKLELQLATRNNDLTC